MDKEGEEEKEKEVKEEKEEKEETEINNCSICCCEITLQTGNSSLSCQHSFHLKCISRWLSKNNSCPCCRNQVSLEFENLRCLGNGENGERDEARDELNERIDELDNDENEGNEGNEGDEGDEWDEGSYNDEDFGGLIMISIGGLKELGAFYCRACFDDDDENENDERNKLLEELNSKLTQDFFDNFCGGATISVRFDSRNVIPFTQQHFSHCFIKYYPTYLFFLGFFCKSAKINAFWNLWERIRVRQNTLGLFQNDFSINSSFILMHSDNECRV
jgi:hypothetical protein